MQQPHSATDHKIKELSGTKEKDEETPGFSSGLQALWPQVSCATVYDPGPVDTK